jgi:uncharacterized membrane protein YebE (DUF533 family)
MALAAAKARGSVERDSGMERHEAATVTKASTAVKLRAGALAPRLGRREGRKWKKAVYN